MRRIAFGIALLFAADGRSQSAPPLDPQSCKTLPLADASAETRDRAASHLYSRCDRAVLSDPTLAANLIAGIRRSTPSAAGAIVLLGYLPEARRELLQLARQSAANRVKLQSWNLPVPAATAAAVALARLGDAAGKAQLKALALDQSLATREFLTDVLPDLARSDRALLLPYLDDPREIRSGVPSGAKPRRRMRDAAFYSLVKLLRLPVENLIESRRFTEEEFMRWRPKIEAALSN